jgi:ribosome-binding factor A
MTFKKVSWQQLRSLCSELGEDDGLDPRQFFRKPSGKVANRKALQLCGEVARTLNLIFAGGCGDAVLRDLAVESVVPAPNASRLLVSVYRTAPSAGLSAEQVLEHLQRAHGMLRSQVAMAVHRRRAPDLTFRVVEVT